ncbi:hypothetical protein KKH56_01060 [bacterium]|nr:hypothetical protein [bacterium]
MYLSIGIPQKGAVYVELDHEQILRVHPKTKEVLGLTIMNFSNRFSMKKPFTSVPLTANLIPEKKIEELVQMSR